MDQALDWLILLESPSPEQARQFHDWLNASPLHSAAFDKAQAIWNGPQVVRCAQNLDTQKPRSARCRACVRTGGPWRWRRC